MIGRSLAVARITSLELVRSRTLWVIVPILLVEMAAWWLMSETHLEARAKTLLNATLLAINVFGLLGALTLAGGTIPRDLERRHLYFVFVKPLRNWEFLVGKALGVMSVLGVVVGVAALAMGALVLTDDAAPEVRARARAKKIVTPLTGVLGEQGDLRLPLARILPRGRWRLTAAGPEVTSLEWTVPGLVGESKLSGSYRLYAGNRAFAVAPVIVEDRIVLAVPEGARQRDLELEVSHRRGQRDVMPMAAVQGRPPVQFRAGPVDPDFEKGGAARLVVDLKNIMPGGQWTLLIRRGEAVCQATVTARERHVIELPRGDPGTRDIDLELALVGGNRPAFNVTPRRLWIEGRQHPLLSNIWRGFGIAWLHLCTVAVVTLVGSVFLTQPTSMLLGFTFFITAHSLGALRELPEILFMESALKPGQSLPVHVLEDPGFQAMSAMMGALADVLPDFSRFSPGTYFTRGEYLPMGAFWTELGAATSVLLSCVILGSLAVMRKEFLK